jgi:Family of unknown function (DUF5719)
MKIRGRLLVALALAAIVVATGTVFERVLGTKPTASSEPPAETSGGWMCPHGGGEGYRGWVVAVNATDRPAEVVLTTYGPAEPRAIRDVVPAGSQVYFEVPSERMASASVLEFFGPPLVAGMVTRRGEGMGLAAEPCAPDAGRRWFVPEGTSVRGQAAALVVVNPFAQEAVLDIAMYTDDEIIRHGNLSGVVIPPRRAEAFDLNRFALGAESLLADVRVSLGKVAVAGFGLGTESGLRGTLGVREAAPTSILPGASVAEPARVTVLGTEGQDAPFQVLAQGPEGSKVVLEEEEVPAHSVQSLEIPGGEAGVVVQGVGQVPFVAGRRLAPAAPEPPPEPPKPPKGGKGQDGKDGRGGAGGKGGTGGQAGRGQGDKPEPEPEPEVADLAATAGASRPAATWVAASPLPVDGGGSFLILQNPGGSPGQGHVTLLSEEGVVGTPIPVTVAPGSTTTLDLADEGGMQPLAAVVRLSTGRTVVAQVAIGPGGYAVSMATPVEPSSTLEGLGI